MTLINSGGKVRIVPTGRGVPQAALVVIAPVLLLGFVLLISWMYGLANARLRGPSTLVAYREIIARQTPEEPTSSDLPRQTFQPISAEDAVRINASTPLSSSPRLIAAHYTALLEPNGTFSASLACLTAAVYYEAGAESLAGRQAVAQVVLNRLAHPAFPKTVCDVVNQGSKLKTGCQFTFTCDGSLSRAPNPQMWKAAQSVAEAALNGFVFSEVGASTHYHADYVVPTWAPEMIKLTQIGRHIFYRWPGLRALLPVSAGQPAALDATAGSNTTEAVLAAEPATAPLGSSTAPEQTQPPPPVEVGPAPASDAPAPGTSASKSATTATPTPTPIRAPARQPKPHLARPEGDMRQSSPF